jgi:hypothetical protein
MVNSRLNAPVLSLCNGVILPECTKCDRILRLTRDSGSILKLGGELSALKQQRRKRVHLGDDLWETKLDNDDVLWEIRIAGRSRRAGLNVRRSGAQTDIR